MSKVGKVVLSGLFVALGGCAETLPGHYWEVDLSVADDGCNASQVGYSDTLEYRVEFGTSDVTLSIGSDTFATGTISGCTVAYQTVTSWVEPRAAGDVRWVLSGEATVQREQGSCGIANGWQGTETFTVVSSDDPGINPGCDYVINVTGDYLGEEQ